MPAKSTYGNNALCPLNYTFFNYAKMILRNAPAKLVKFRHARPLYRLKQIPDRALTLNPFAPTCLLNQDRLQALNFGLVAIDCSWEKVQAAFTARLPGSEHQASNFACLESGELRKTKQAIFTRSFGCEFAYNGFPGKSQRITLTFQMGTTFPHAKAAQPLAAYASVTDEEQLVSVESEYF